MFKFFCDVAGKDAWVVNPVLFIKEHSRPCSAQTSLTQNCPELTILGFLTTSFLFLVVSLAFKQIDQVLKWKSGLKVPLLPLGPSCPLQTILLSDLVGCDSPHQIVIVIWRTL